jgi:hypothetical protein
MLEPLLRPLEPHLLEGLGTGLLVPILELDAEKNFVFNSGRYSSRREEGSQWSLK